jgi:hypothetical protein
MTGLGLFLGHLVAGKFFVSDTEVAKLFVSGGGDKGGRGSIFGAKGLEALGLCTNFSVFEDFLLRGETG